MRIAFRKNSRYRTPIMETKETLLKLCYDEKGNLKQKNECRAAMINYLILEQGIDIDAAEDLADKTLNESGFWPMPKLEWDEEDAPPTSQLSTDGS